MHRRTAAAMVMVVEVVAVILKAARGPSQEDNPADETKRNRGK
jgi:hypothetical protein